MANPQNDFTAHLIRDSTAQKRKKEAAFERAVVELMVYTTEFNYEQIAQRLRYLIDQGYTLGAAYEYLQARLAVGLGLLPDDRDEEYVKALYEMTEVDAFSELQQSVVILWGTVFDTTGMNRVQRWAIRSLERVARLLGRITFRGD